jgi:hypothetical protein
MRFHKTEERPEDLDIFVVLGATPPVDGKGITRVLDRVVGLPHLVGSACAR